MEWIKFEGFKNTSGKLLLSTSLFFFPKYSKIFNNKFVDESNNRQHSFMNVIAYYEKIFKDHKWFRDNVILRIYYDNSLLMWNDGEWNNIISKASKNIEWVKFQCMDSKFHEWFPETTTSKAFMGHRGLIGTLIRYHALYDFPENKNFNSICLIDVDTVYTFDWWKLQTKLAISGKQCMAAIAGLFETPIFGTILTEDSNMQKRMAHAGLFSLIGTRFDADDWLNYPRMFKDTHLYAQALDYMRCALFPDTCRQERLYIDFAYGYDELLLNYMIIPKYAGKVEYNVVDTARDPRRTMKFFISRFLMYLKWNGSRSVVLTQLGGLMKTDVVEFVEKLSQTQYDTWSDVYTKVIMPFKPHIEKLRQLEIDHRLVHIFESIDADYNPLPSNLYITDVADVDVAKMHLISGGCIV